MKSKQQKYTEKAQTEDSYYCTFNPWLLVLLTVSEAFFSLCSSVAHVAKEKMETEFPSITDHLFLVHVNRQLNSSLTAAPALLGLIRPEG